VVDCESTKVKSVENSFHTRDEGETMNVSSARATATAVGQTVLMPMLKNKDINPAANSKFWLPLKGAVYFFKHPKLWEVVLMPLCCAICLDLAGFIAIFAAALFPQALAFQQIPALQGDLVPVTFLIATVLCFLECLLLVVITANVVLGHWGGKLFKKTLELEGVPPGRELPCSEECSFSFWMGSLRFFLQVVLLPVSFWSFSCCWNFFFVRFFSP
jgi:hypothetical protein